MCVVPWQNRREKKRGVEKEFFFHTSEILGSNIFMLEHYHQMIYAFQCESECEWEKRTSIKMGEKERKSKNNKNKEKHTHEIHRIIQNWKENIMSSIFLAMQKKNDRTNIAWKWRISNWMWMIRFIALSFFPVFAE